MNHLIQRHDFACACLARKGAKLVKSLAACALLAASPEFGAAADPPGATPPAANSAIKTWTNVETVADDAAKTCCTCNAVDWKLVPTARPLARPGMFTVPPAGPGFYTLQDQLRGDCKEKPPIQPYGAFSFVPLPSYDLDFRYLDKPDNKQHDFWDPLKRIHMGDNWLLSLGGQTWMRHLHEVDSRLTTSNNDYALLRSRMYADLWYRDQFRIFAEFLYADSFGPDLAPLPIDINRSDMQNLFVEFKVGEIGDQPVRARLGRQELVLGSQRLISALDWANTRRTFQGARCIRQSEKFDIDAFWVQPVAVDRNQFDSVDNNQNFAGLWTTYKPKKGTSVDLYFLNLDQTSPVAVGAGGVAGGFNVSTLGSRFAGDRDGLLWDFEGMLQFGSWANQDLFAQAATAGIGYQMADLPANPQFWLYYDWASGEETPGVGGQRGTFNQLFPFGHYYFGFIDQVARQNISDINLQAVAYPANWATAIVQFHHFRLDSPRDALYNAAGRVVRSSAAGAAGTFVGNEIDLLLSLHLTTHADLLLGWSKLFAGGFIDNTGPAVSPELLYVQYSYRW